MPFKTMIAVEAPWDNEQSCPWLYMKNIRIIWFLKLIDF
jgi:hypothetical protein